MNYVADFGVLFAAIIMLVYMMWDKLFPHDD